MHVTDFKARTLAGQTAWPERRETTLVRDLGERVGLIHELRQLARAKELAHRSGSRLGVDQVLRHDGVDLDRRHALLDRPLHAEQTEPVVVFHQFADRTHPAVAEVVDVVDLATAITQVDERANHLDDVFLAQDANRVLGLDVEAHVHLDAANGADRS